MTKHFLNSYLVPGEYNLCLYYLILMQFYLMSISFNLNEHGVAKLLMHESVIHLLHQFKIIIIKYLYILQV